jgi:putative ATP-dependent endonuclease of OLD family
MLFARGVILVEGLSEQILLPTFAEACGHSLADEHVAVVGVGALTFKHYLPLFGALLDEDHLALDRRVACIIDADPRRKQGDEFYKCYPYQLESADEHRRQSGAVDRLEQYASDVPNIGIFSGEKTLEYDLAKVNWNSDLLVTSCCSHADDLRALGNDGTFSEKLQEKVADAVEDLDSLDGEEKAAARFATAYLECITGKGEHAQELNLNLREPKTQFAVPEHIEDAIEWVCNPTT